MNIILIGANGAGKSTIANRLYKDGYHVLKFSPMTDNHDMAVELPTKDYNLVLDRWAVVDRIIYRGDYSWLGKAVLNKDPINEHTIILHLVNHQDNYDPSESDKRIVQRPNEEERKRLAQEYVHATSLLYKLGFNIHTVEVGNEKDTYKEISKLINSRMSNY